MHPLSGSRASPSDGSVVDASVVTAVHHAGRGLVPGQTDPWAAAPTWLPPWPLAHMSMAAARWPWVQNARATFMELNKKAEIDSNFEIEYLLNHNSEKYKQDVKMLRKRICICYYPCHDQLKLVSCLYLRNTKRAEYEWDLENA